MIQKEQPSEGCSFYCEMLEVAQERMSHNLYQAIGVAYFSL